MAMIDFTTVLNDLKGEPLLNGEDEVTLGEVCVLSLTAIDKSDNTDGDEKYKRYKLAQDISVSGDLNLKAAQIVMLKKLVGKAYGPLVVGRVYDILEPAIEKE